MGKGIIVDGQTIHLIDAPVTGDVAITHDGVSTIGAGMITTDMLSSALKQILYPVAEVGTSKVGYCQVG